MISLIIAKLNENIKINIKLQITFRILLLIFFLANSASLYALNWKNGYGSAISVANDDNYSLLPENEVKVTSTRLNVYVASEGADELNLLKLKVSGSLESHSDNSIDDQANAALSLSFNQSGERLQKNINLAYSEDPTVETELLDSGIIVDSTKNTAGLVMGLTYHLNERNSYLVNLSFNDVAYDTILLNDYRNTSLVINWVHQINEKSNFSLITSLSKFDPMDLGSTNNSSLNFDYEFSVSEITSYNLSMGFSAIDEPDNYITGSNYSIGMYNKYNEKNLLSLMYKHSYKVSGLGFVREEDKLTMSWVTPFSEKLQGKMNVDGIHSTEREYLAIKPSVQYFFNSHSSISGSFQFRQQDALSSKSKSHKLMVLYNYNH